MKCKYIKSITLSCVGLLVIIIIACHYSVENAHSNAIFSSLAETPNRHVGLLLGCSATLKNGNINLFFKYRIDAAEALLKSNKINYLLISGDNSTANYDETTQMRDELIKRGIDANRLILDFAGFRTLDSVVRAKAVFNVQSILVISQEFHNKRALYIADHHDIPAIAFNARDVNIYGGFKTKVREVLARVKVVLDIYILNTSPKFLGKVETVPKPGKGNLVY